MRYNEGVTCEAAQVSNARNMTSTILWVVRTFPPTTAAVSDGDKIVPDGMISWTGFKQPYGRLTFVL